MTWQDEKIRKLERVLAETHQARQAPLLRPGWAEQVMRDIRSAETQPAPHIGVERLVWKTAAIAAAVALIVTVSMMTWSHAPSTDGIGLLTEEFESTPLFLD